MTKFDNRSAIDSAKTPTTAQATDTELSARRIGSDVKAWQERVEYLISEGAVIVTLRGAGSVNGIDPIAASRAVGMIRDYIISLRSCGTSVALMYDGDGDNRAKLDVGSLFGELADSFARDSSVKFIAAQSEGWYGPPDKNDPIKSSNGTPYETFVFAGDPPGQHASLTQSSALVAYPRYEQIFVGPAGKITFSQLQDLSDKAVASRDIEQRRDNPFGFLSDSEGRMNLGLSRYPGLSFKRSLIQPY